MSMTSVRSHHHLAPLGLGLLAFALLTIVLATPPGGGSTAPSADAVAASHASRSGQDTGPEYTTGDPKSLNVGGATGAGAQSASSAKAGDGAGFPWKVSLLIFAGGLVATVIAYVVTGRSTPRPPRRSTKL